MEKNYKLIVPNIKDRQRIDKYITVFVENATRTKVQKSINMGNVLVNGNFVKSNYILKPYDEIDIELPVPDKQEIVPENIPLDIVFEDEYLLVVNKPAGMVTHPAYKNYSGTLVNAVMFYSLKKKDSLSSLNGFERAGIVHRLDKDTSGLMVVAKNDAAMAGFVRLFKTGGISKEYLTLVHGVPPKPSGTVRSLIGRHPGHRKRMAVVARNGKEAVTHYAVERRLGDMTLVRCRIETGRTHQIRVHMQSLGCPVIGDALYGKSAADKCLPHLPARQMLHAAHLTFTHPVTGAPMDFVAPLPEDFLSFLV